MQNRNSTNPQGIDVSSYQAGIDFSAIKTSGVSIVYIKATEGTNYINPLLQDFYARAKAQGLKVGFYHFYHPNLDAIAQAQCFINAIKTMAYDCKPVLDVELNGGLNAATLSIKVRSCLNEIEYLTKNRPVIYTFTAFAKSSLVYASVGSFPVWIADYNTTGKPGDNPVWANWVGYQYSDAGKIGGISVDMDEFTSDIFTVSGMTVVEAIAVLNAKGVISTPTYWTNAATNIKNTSTFLSNLDNLLINMAKKLEG